MTRRPDLRSERGAVLVEFAMLVPFLLFFMFGIAQMSTFFNYKNDANQLAAVAARYAAVNRVPPPIPGCPSTTLQAWIVCQADTSELRSGGTAQVAAPIDVKICVPDGNVSGRPVKASVSLTYRFFAARLVEDFVTYFGGDYDRETTGRAYMRLESPASNWTPDGTCA
jgi:hypothetical protein